MKKFIVFVLSLCLLDIMPVAADDTVTYIAEQDITDDLQLEGDAVYDEAEDAILLCPAETWSSGKAKYPFEVLEDFTVSFDYKIGGGTSADGIILAFYAEKDSVTDEGHYLNFEGCGGYGLEFDTYRNANAKDSANAHIAVVRDSVSNHLVSVDEERVDDEDWHTAMLGVKGNNICVTIDGDVIFDELIEFEKTYRYMYFAAATGSCTDNHYIKNVKFTGRAAYSNASEWATDEMDKAEMYNLIPDDLKGKDMTQPINRSEFASLSVKLYESITDSEAADAEEPFVDVEHSEVAKAYGLGITKGISDTLFAPEKHISREEVATMLTRTMKASAPDLNTEVLGYTKFADDDKISDWAKESVYFMVSQKIILGIGDNMFAPKNTTSGEEAEMYANATREQAVAMSVRAYETLNGNNME